MIYLLAKYTLLFLLASILGFVLGYWWSRRKIVDVSESYEDLRKATQKTDAGNWDQLWNRLDAIPGPKETDLSPVVERLDGVRSAVAGIPQPPKPEAPDFRPLTDRIDKLEQHVRAIPAPADIGPLNERLRGLETAIRNIPAPAPQQKLDLKPVHDDLSSIREQIRRMPKVETHEAVSLTPVVRQIDALEQRVKAIPRPDKVDLRPIDGRLRGIEREILRLDKRLARPAKATPKAKLKRKSATREKPAGQPRILSAALYGTKDDLKRISGVGPKLERLLNKNGVYYFWQVASWSRTDIKTIDERLESFKGRITRDDWVSQAKQLKQAPEAARTPAS